MKLNEREMAIIKLCTKGYTLKQMAHELQLTFNQVIWSFAALKKKLNVHTAVGVTMKGIELGLIDGYCKSIQVQVTASDIKIKQELDRNVCNN